MTREEAIQILSTRDAHGVLCGYTSGVTEALDMAIEALQIEIIRCKECKYYSVEGETTRFSWCNALEMPTDEMRYCSDGERRR